MIKLVKIWQNNKKYGKKIEQLCRARLNNKIQVFNNYKNKNKLLH